MADCSLKIATFRVCEFVTQTHHYVQVTFAYIKRVHQCRRSVDQVMDKVKKAKIVSSILQYVYAKDSSFLPCSWLTDQ